MTMNKFDKNEAMVILYKSSLNIVTLIFRKIIIRNFRGLLEPKTSDLGYIT